MKQKRNMKKKIREISCHWPDTSSYTGLNPYSIQKFLNFNEFRKNEFGQKFNVYFFLYLLHHETKQFTYFTYRYSYFCTHIIYFTFLKFSSFYSFPIILFWIYVFYLFFLSVSPHLHKNHLKPKIIWRRRFKPFLVGMRGER